MLKSILFDFGQTLVDSAYGFRTAEKTAQKKLFKHLNITTWDNFLSIYRLYRTQFHEKSIFSRNTVWKSVVEHFNVQLDMNIFKKLENEYWEHVKSWTKVFPETFQVLTKLTVNHTLALITNTQGQKSLREHRISFFPKLEKFFKVIIIAGDGEVPPKPDPKPFLLCLEKLGISPKEAIYVGDDWRIDISGAKNVGIQPIWLQHHSVHRSWPKVSTDVPIITRLDQLFELTIS